MRATTAYFVGAGTVVAAIAAGLGGGLLIANIVNPASQSHEMTRLEQRMSEKPIPVIAAPSAPVPSIATTQATSPAVATPAPQAQPGPAHQTEAANDKQAAEPPAQPVAAREPADSNAKTREVEARDADIKRAATEKRRTERRQQWADKRRYRQRQDDTLRDVEQKVREETEPTQAFAAEPARLEMPRIRFFEAE
jgi:hypothetical protein